MGANCAKNSRFSIIHPSDGKVPPRLIAGLGTPEGKNDYSGVFAAQQKSLYSVDNPIWDLESGNSYSVDMVRANFKYSGDDQELIMMLDCCMVFDVVDTYASTKFGSYRYLWTYDFADCANGGGEYVDDEGELQYDGTKGVVVKVGYSLNTKQGARSGFIEWNPNKCNNARVKKLYTRMYDLGCDFELARWDLAIDVPVDRRAVRLVKDKRKYEFHESNGITEYLGQRSNPGRVKVYDKSAEQDIEEYKITRVELTCDKSWGAPKIAEMLPDCREFYSAFGLGGQGKWQMALTLAFADIQAASQADCELGNGFCALFVERYLSMLPHNTKYKLKKVLKKGGTLFDYQLAAIDGMKARVDGLLVDMNGGGFGAASCNKTVGDEEADARWRELNGLEGKR